jgi:hypothetical protein
MGSWSPSMIWWWLGHVVIRPRFGVKEIEGWAAQLYVWLIDVHSSSIRYVNLCSSLNPSSFLSCNPSSVVEGCFCSKKRCLCLLLMMIMRISLSLYCLVRKLPFSVFFLYCLFVMNLGEHWCFCSYLK